MGSPLRISSIHCLFVYLFIYWKRPMIAQSHIKNIKIRRLKANKNAKNKPMKKALHAMSLCTHLYV